MNCVLTNGHTYISKKTNGKFVSTYDLNRAIVFESKDKAENVLRNLPRGYEAAGYYVKFIEEETPQPICVDCDRKNDDLAQEQKVYSFSIDDSKWLSDLKSNLRIVEKTLGHLKEEYSRIYGELNNVNGDIEDIEHAIEFLNPNAVRKCYLESELKKARRKRRECKDAMFLMELVMKFDLDDWSKGKVEQTLEQMNSRVYKPKSRSDLFE